MVEAPLAPKPFALPAEFPVTWDEPMQAMLPWQQDRMHMPDPASPMSSWWALTFAKGFSAGLASYGLPMACNTTRVNTYFYMSIAPNVPPEQMPAIEAEAVPRLMGGIATFWNRWENEWLPELRQTWADWSAQDFSAMTDAELKTATGRLLEIYQRAWTIHFEMLVPALVGMSSYTDAYQDLFPDAAPLDAYRLLQGYDSMSLEAGRGLWALSRKVRANPDLAAIVMATPSSDLVAKLEASDAGRAFMADMREYLAYYGRRSDGVQELAPASWTEDPAPALTNLKAYVMQDDSEDPSIQHAKLAAERDALQAAAREAIASYPEAIRDQFEGLLAAGIATSRVQEDHNFWIDQRALHEVRQHCLEYGRRLVTRGQLETPADVLLFTMPEVQELLDSGADGKDTVIDRKAEMERWRAITPPPSIGMDYGPPPDNPVTRAIGRFFGGVPMPENADITAGDLQGYPGSGGVVRGTARVIMSISEGARLGQGEILVAPTTAPPWTPLFATAAAVVTDTGGPLSHCAIVAREYGIPAVVGIAGATVAIKDGMTVEVDGNQGVVRILS